MMITKYVKILLIFMLSLLLVSCSILPSVEPKSDYVMQTEIVQILTAMVTPTAMTPGEELTALATPTANNLLEPTSEYLPMETPQETIIPTDEIGQLATSTPVEGFINTPASLPLDGPISTSPTVASQPDVTPTAVPGDPVKDLGAPTWKDTFDSGDNWPMGVDEYVDLKTSSGSLMMTGRLMKNGWRLSNQQAVNFYLELTGKMAACKGSDNFGLIFRVPNATMADRGYLFGISCDGKYALRKWDIDKMSNIINWTVAPTILVGSNQVNRLGVMARGNELKLFVNGKLVNTVTDQSFGHGYFGLYIGPKETTFLTSNLEEISFWVLP